MDRGVVVAAVSVAPVDARAVPFSRGPAVSGDVDHHLRVRAGLGRRHVDHQVAGEAGREDVRQHGAQVDAGPRRRRRRRCILARFDRPVCFPQVERDPVGNLERGPILGLRTADLPAAHGSRQERPDARPGTQGQPLAGLRIGLGVRRAGLRLVCGPPARSGAGTRRACEGVAEDRAGGEDVVGEAARVGVLFADAPPGLSASPSSSTHERTISASTSSSRRPLPGRPPRSVGASTS